ncbi:MAG: enoyl-CoA hydratase-related protein, partial [Flavobacteriales bacterium]
MIYENLTLHTEAGVQTITINRPSKLNALNSATIQELSTALKASNTNPAIRVIVLTGSGEKAFV